MNNKIPTLYAYLSEAYSIKKLKEKVACANCGSKEDLIADPDTDSFVCEWCAKNSYVIEDGTDILWAEMPKKEKGK